MNAKELILGRLGAKEDTLDMYTLLAALGVSMHDCIEILGNNELLKEVLNEVKEDVFTPKSYGTTIQNGLNLFLYDGKSKIKGRLTTQFTLSELKGFISAIKPELSRRANILLAAPLELQNVQNIDDYNNDLYKLISEIASEISRRDSNRKNDMSEIDYEAMYDEIYADAYYSDDQDINDTPKREYRNLSRTELCDLMQFFGQLIRRNKTIKKLADDSNYFNWIKYTKTIRDRIYPMLEEHKMIAFITSINQGLKSSSYEMYKFITRIDNFVNNKCEVEKGDERFSFVKFMNDESYQKKWIDKLNEKSTYANVLDVIKSNDMIMGMLEVGVNTINIINTSSFLSRETFNICDKVTKNLNLGRPLTKPEFNIIERYVWDGIITSFFNFLPEGKQISINLYEDDEVWKDSKWNKLDKEDVLNLTDVVSLMEFNHLAYNIIKDLKKKYKNNYFINHLVLNSKEQMFRQNGTETQYGFAPIWEATSINQDNLTINAQNHKAYMIAGLKDIISTELTTLDGKSRGMTIGDFFYLYNLIVYKDSSLNGSFGELFSGIPNTIGSLDVMKMFESYISEVDGNYTISKVIEEYLSGGTEREYIQNTDNNLSSLYWILRNSQNSTLRNSIDANNKNGATSISGYHSPEQTFLFDLSVVSESDRRIFDEVKSLVWNSIMDRIDSVLFPKYTTFASNDVRSQLYIYDENLDTSELNDEYYVVKAEGLLDEDKKIKIINNILTALNAGKIVLVPKNITGEYINKIKLSDLNNWAYQNGWQRSIGFIYSRENGEFENFVNQKLMNLNINRNNILALGLNENLYTVDAKKDHLDQSDVILDSNVSVIDKAIDICVEFGISKNRVKIYSSKDKNLPKRAVLANGYTDGINIYLNRDRINENTMIHEILHLVLYGMKQHDINLLKNDPNAKSTYEEFVKKFMNLIYSNEELEKEFEQFTLDNMDIADSDILLDEFIIHTLENSKEVYMGYYAKSGTIADVWSLIRQSVAENKILIANTKLAEDLTKIYSMIREEVKNKTLEIDCK